MPTHTPARAHTHTLHAHETRQIRLRHILDFDLRSLVRLITKAPQNKFLDGALYIGHLIIIIIIIIIMHVSQVRSHSHLGDRASGVKWWQLTCCKPVLA